MSKIKLSVAKKKYINSLTRKSPTTGYAQMKKKDVIKSVKEQHSYKPKSKIKTISDRLKTGAKAEKAGKVLKGKNQDLTTFKGRSRIRHANSETVRSSQLSKLRNPTNKDKARKKIMYHKTKLLQSFT